MPIYEYRCEGCETVHEITQRITEDALTKCPESGGKMERMISASAFALKGSGWYKTDYERKGKDKTKAPAEGKGGGESSGDAGSGDSAPASTEKDVSGHNSKDPSKTSSQAA